MADQLTPAQQNTAADAAIRANPDLRLLLTATDEEFDAYIECPHTGSTYTDPGPLTGHLHTRCADCHTVIPEEKQR